MIKLSKLTKEFPQKQILNEIDWFISPTDKVGLIGVNGAGKSTLMKILIKQEEADSGNIYIAPGTNVTYLSQELPEFKQRVLIDELRNTFPEIVSLQNELNHLEEKMQLESREDKLESLVTRYSFIQEDLIRLDAQMHELEMFKVLKGLGFSDTDFNRPLGEFSGGWQMRVALAKLLLEKPDLLLLDEPTNHLDIDAIEWLEGHLREYQGAIVLISHDKRFLDNVVSRISELENARLTDYPGNYSKYLILKEEYLDSLASAKERQDKEIAKMQTFVDRFRANANRSSQAKSREKMLNKIERIELPQEQAKIHFKFPAPPSTGRIVLKLKELEKSYDGLELFRLKNEIWVERGDKIAILGANGVGKTTLMKIITGEEEASNGSVEFGHNVSFSFFAQNQSEKLNMDNTVIDEIYDLVPEYTLTKVRSLLGRFLFRDDRAFQEVSTLSGGEKSRLAIAKMLLSPSNLLFLDEPTNHLDLPSKEVLINALNEFPETVIAISHDRDFIARICNKIYEITDRDIRIYEGNYDYYREQKEKQKLSVLQKASESYEKAEPKVQEAKEYRQEQKEKQKLLNSLEKKILKLEEKISVLEKDLADPEIYSDSEKLVKLNSEYANLKSELDKNYQVWEELAVS